MGRNQGHWLGVWLLSVVEEYRIEGGTVHQSIWASLVKLQMLLLSGSHQGVYLPLIKMQRDDCFCFVDNPQSALLLESAKRH